MAFPRGLPGAEASPRRPSRPPAFGGRPRLPEAALRAGASRRLPRRGSAAPVRLSPPPWTSSPWRPPLAFFVAATAFFGATRSAFFTARVLPGAGRSLPRPCLLLGAGHRRPVYDETSARYSRIPCAPGRWPWRGRTRFISSRIRCSTSTSRTRNFACCTGVSMASSASTFLRGLRAVHVERLQLPSRSRISASLAPPWRRRRRISRTVRVRSRK